jgi:hypothetical protein
MHPGTRQHPLGKLVSSYDQPTGMGTPGARSARETTSRATPTGPGLLIRPGGDLRAEPKLDAALTEVEHRPRHVSVSLLVLEHRVPISEAEDLRHALRVDQVVSVGADHLQTAYIVKRIRPGRVIA